MWVKDLGQSRAVSIDDELQVICMASNQTKPVSNIVSSNTNTVSTTVSNTCTAPTEVFSPSTALNKLQIQGQHPSGKLEQFRFTPKLTETCTNVTVTRVVSGVVSDVADVTAEASTSSGSMAERSQPSSEEVLTAATGAVVGEADRPKSTGGTGHVHLGHPDCQSEREGSVRSGSEEGFEPARTKKQKKTIRKERQKADATEKHSHAAAVSGAGKRARAPGDTPKAVKKPRFNATGLPEHLQVAIVKAAGHRLVMTELEGESIRNMLVEKILNVPVGGEVGCFNQSGLCAGTFKVSCDSEKSLEWLKTAVSTMKLGEEELEVCTQSSLKLIAASVWIPGPPRDHERVFKTLEVQNPGIGSMSWRKYNTVYRGDGSARGQVILFGMDEDSAAAVRSRRGSLFHELSKVQVKFKAEGRDGGHSD